MSCDDTLQPPKPLRPIPWWLALCGVGVIALSIMGVYWWLDTSASTSAAGNTQDARLRLEIIRNALTVGAGLAGVAALLLAFRRQHFVEKQHAFQEQQQARHEWDVQADREQRERIAESERTHRERVADDTDRDATERRSTDLRIQAVEQLGSDKTPVRIGGLHNLERLGNEQPQLRTLVLSQICAYLRLPFAPPETLPADDLLAARQERQVRLTAQRVLARCVAKGEGHWDHHALDLSGASLVDFQIRDAEMRGTNLSGAELFGNTSFERVDFGCSLNLVSVEAQGPVTFLTCGFQDDSDFSSGEFHASLRFHSCAFFGEADFEAATLHKPCEFTNTVADLDPSRLHHWPPGWQPQEEVKRPGWGMLLPEPGGLAPEKLALKV